jgi:hypothetical protein
MRASGSSSSPLRASAVDGVIVEHADFRAAQSIRPHAFDGVLLERRVGTRDHAIIIERNR